MAATDGSNLLATGLYESMRFCSETFMGSKNRSRTGVAFLVRPYSPKTTAPFAGERSRTTAIGMVYQDQKPSRETIPDPRATPFNVAHAIGEACSQVLGVSASNCNLGPPCSLVRSSFTAVPVRMDASSMPAKVVTA